jgi:GDP-4-dehydro-6-deoxy-D-mannose reductase
LESIKDHCTVLGVDVNSPAFDQTKYRYIHCSFQIVDLLNRKQVDNILYNFQPDYILHLASYSSVAYSWKNPVSAFVNNSNIFLNLIDQVRVLNLRCRILSVGSSEEYGKIDLEALPLHEELATHPTSPYAVARVTQEMLSQIYAEGYGIDVVLTRSFNHIGPGQKAIFAISSFAKKLVEIQTNLGNQRKISVGNIEVVRDFVDVRDVVRAYYLLFQNGKKGEVYNICSGKGHSLRDILTKMMATLDLKVEFTVDSQLIRPGENKIVIGSNNKIKNEVGWEPTIAFEKSLIDIIGYWKKEIQ